jgi:hypothetical protein
VGWTIVQQIHNVANKMHSWRRDDSGLVKLPKWVYAATTFENALGGVPMFGDYPVVARHIRLRGPSRSRRLHGL